MLIAHRFRRVSRGQYPPLLLLPLFDVVPPPCEFPSDGHPVKARETSMRNANNSLVVFIVISCERDRRASGLRIVNVRRSHDIPFEAVSDWRGETDLVFAAKAPR
ncbi:MAG: hypothetical protein QOF74_7680 [Caballeronia mineralivorans]|jgi:hypothetical protein|nr:hypothetical protein [Caballeronia mineralivorans]